MRLNAIGLTYPEACQLSTDLEAAGIDSNISTGALAIHSQDFDGTEEEWQQVVMTVAGDRAHCITTEESYQVMRFTDPEAARQKRIQWGVE